MSKLLLIFNILLISRIIYIRKDQQQNPKQLTISVIILLLSILVIQYSLALWIFIAFQSLITFSFYLIERWKLKKLSEPDEKNQAIVSIRFISLIVHFVFINFYIANWINLQNSSLAGAWLDSFLNNFAVVELLPSINLLNVNTIIFGLLLTTNEANLFIRYLLLINDLEPKAEKENGLDTEEFHRGRIIGNLERILIFLFVLGNEFTAIGFFLTAKGITRFRQMDESHEKEMADYILVGTLFSTLLAILSGYIAQALLK